MKSKKILVVALIAIMCFTTILAGCGKTETEETNDTLVVGYSYFNSKFSPFFSETAYDQDVYAMTALGLLSYDRQGQVITQGIEGETRAYNGTDYTYYGPADVEITENADGTVYYDFTLRDDLTFSDGEAVTIDDVIFSMYVLSDPTYDGSSTFYSLPIEGMDAYRAGMDTLFNLLVAAGKDNTDYTYWTAETQTAFWADLEQAGAAFVQEIVDYCMTNYADYGAVDVATSMSLWGFDAAADATTTDVFYIMAEAYGWDLGDMSSTETAGSSLFDLMEDYASYSVGVTTGETAANITGIQKTGDYTLRIVFTEVDATWYTQLGVVIAPLHYYGSEDLYDYDNNMFGFTKGDLSVVKAVTTTPMGAGPYKFISFENGTVRFEANESYYLGAPKIKYIQFLESSDTEKVNGVVSGTIDITDPSISSSTVDTIKATNSNGELSGDKIVTNLVDNLGYGYIGMCAYTMNIGGDPDSEASKNLRKAFATVFCVYRDLAIDSYYGERASVINYPISNTSWAAPQASDPDYEIAFSKDIDGNEIYTSDMTAEEKYAAALNAALGYFEAAGFTVVDGKITAAPEGGTLEYKAVIPGDGTGDHPTFMVFSEAKEAFESIGLTFEINDLADSSQLWDMLDANQCQIWAAAWGATVDPDMYQIYYSDIANYDGSIAAGTTKNPYGGAAQGGSNYEYCIADAELDELILQGRKTADSSVRKSIYKAALDIVVDWAVEIPVYQRQNGIIFNPQTVNMDTVTPDITTFYGWMSEIQNTELN